MLGAIVAHVWAYRYPASAALALAGAWCVAEVLGRTSTWRQGAPKRPGSGMDRGTYPAIALAMGSSMVVTFLCFLFGFGYLPVELAPVGAILTATGVGLRLWAMRTLGRFFTMPITIRPDHRIVSDGPYRRLRHPAYTGNLLAALGMPLLLGTLPGLIFTLVACLLVYVHRIRIEEAALLSRFGEDYVEYSKRTFRLIPGMY